MRAQREQKFDVFYAGNTLYNFYANSIEECREKVRNFFGVKRLPNGTFIENRSAKNYEWLTSPDQAELFRHS
jgi:hypothetical protein